MCDTDWAGAAHLVPASVGTFPSTGNAAGSHSSLVLSAGNWKVHSGFLLLFPPLATWGCFGAGRTGAVTFLVRRAGGPRSPGRLQRAPRCPSCHKGSLASESTQHGYGFSLAEAGWQHPGHLSPQCSPTQGPGGFLGLVLSALPDRWLWIWAPITTHKSFLQARTAKLQLGRRWESFYRANYQAGLHTSSL